MKRPPSRSAAYLGASGAGVMLLFLGCAAWRGDFQLEARRILEMPWGKTVLVDVYVGLVLFCAWIFARERSPLVATVWTVGILVAGNLATSCYVLWAAATSGAVPARFWMGEKQ